MELRETLFILGLQVLLIEAQGVAGNTTAINAPITTSPPSTTDYHPFESLSLATKAVLYTVALLLGLGCVIASSGCCAWVYCKGRHTERRFPADATDHTEDVTRTQFKYVANNTTITQSDLGIQNPHFTQETGDSGVAPSPVHLPPQGHAGLSVPGNGGESSGQGGRGSLRSVPEETIHASNRMASSIVYSDTMPDGMGTRVHHHQSAVYHQSAV